MVALKDLDTSGVTTPAEREAARILARMIEGLDVTPWADGSIRLTVNLKVDQEFVDRLSLWNSHRDDLEPDGTEGEVERDEEYDARDWAPVVLPPLPVRQLELVAELERQLQDRAA